MKIKRVGVVGCGVMGRGVTQSLVRFGLDAVVIDVNLDNLESGREEIYQGLRFYCFSNKEFDPDEAMEHIRFDTSPDAFSDVDFLVENITEKPSLKEPLYREIDRICQPDCVFAANTSAISITRIASWTERPDRVIGMHFMNPVPMKPVVEVIRGWHTSDETVDMARTFLKAINKKAVNKAF